MGFKQIALALKLQKLSSAINLNITRKFNGKKYIIPVINNIGFDNIFYKPDKFLLKLFDSLKLPSDSTFVDVGINVGQSLLNFVSCKENRYIGFEPNPNCNFYLNKLIHYNKLDNVRIIPVGLSSENSIGKFFITKFIDSSATMIEGLRPGFYDKNKVTYIPLFAFDQLELENLGSISLIKIDVEGGELEVISGMKNSIRKYNPIIICEVLDYHSSEVSEVLQERADKLTSVIKDLEYKIYQIQHSENGKISLFEIEELKLIQWTEKSYDLNDYIFLPRNTLPSTIFRSDAL